MAVYTPPPPPKKGVQGVMVDLKDSPPPSPTKAPIVRVKNHINGVVIPPNPVIFGEKAKSEGALNDDATLFTVYTTKSSGERLERVPFVMKATGIELMLENALGNVVIVNIPFQKEYNATLKSKQRIFPASARIFVGK